MQFLDQAKIYIRSGDGGDGCVSFRREKYIEYGNREIIPNGWEIVDKYDENEMKQFYILVLVQTR